MRHLELFRHHALIGFAPMRPAERAPRAANRAEGERNSKPLPKPQLLERAENFYQIHRSTKTLKLSFSFEVQKHTPNTRVLLLPFVVYVRSHLLPVFLLLLIAELEKSAGLVLVYMWWFCLSEKTFAGPKNQAESSHGLSPKPPLSRIRRTALVPLSPP